MKKIILLSTLLIGLSNLSFSQNILLLKNGDRIKGKLEGLKNDTIIFGLQGNKLKFKTSNITAIFFDEKNAMLDLNKTTQPHEMAQPINGSISGVVTYFFNKNYGDKPDIGAEVHITDSAKIPKFNFATVDSFYYANFYNNLYLQYKSLGSVPADIMESVNKYKLDDLSAFSLLDRRASINIIKIEYASDVIKTIVDGSGKYSVKLKPGTYYVYIKSNNREGISMTEISGKVRCQKVIVKNGMDTNMSCNFGIR